jgi:hypothetical protein
VVDGDVPRARFLGDGVENDGGGENIRRGFFGRGGDALRTRFLGDGVDGEGGGDAVGSTMGFSLTPFFFFIDRVTRRDDMFREGEHTERTKQKKRGKLCWKGNKKKARERESATLNVLSPPLRFLEKIQGMFS